jgi:hypothetical protein
MTINVRIVLVIAIAAFLPSCGSSTAPSPTQASITATLSPNPVMATDCLPTCQGLDGRSFRWRTQGTLTIQETAGIGGNVDSITVTVVRDTINYGSDVIVQRSGTNHVAARGMLTLPLNIFHGPLDISNATRQVVMPFVVQFTDDRGNKLTSITQWSVN